MVTFKTVRERVKYRQSGEPSGSWVWARVRGLAVTSEHRACMHGHMQKKVQASKTDTFQISIPRGWEFGWLIFSFTLASDVIPVAVPIPVQ